MLLASTSFAKNFPDNSLPLYKQPGFFRFSYDYMNMPNNIEKMGLLGVNYFADITPFFYSGVGMYGSTVGSQGGLFVFTVGGGLHHELIAHIWGDAGFDIGGGGGRSSLVGGGLMLRPHAGLQYDFGVARLGVHYSYISFPSGEIHSSQVGANLDIPLDFTYVTQQNSCHTFSLNDLKLPLGKFLHFQRNDFGFLFQGYKQHTGTLNTNGQVQDGTMGLVGAEFDHYFTDSIFGWLKGSGAFTGIPNGYMDILAGLGYHWNLGNSGFAIVPQLGAGAGGGGLVDSGGGVILEPLLGLEIPLSRSFSVRGSGGYLWAPKGELGAYVFSGTLLYHLDVGSLTCAPSALATTLFSAQNWRVNVFNQTYITPQRTFSSTTTPINLLALQIDQLFTPWIFMAYQGSFAYSGDHAGGYATGMIGPGLQTCDLFNKRMNLFGEVLVGAGGGGSLQLGGGALVEPVVGAHFNLTETFGLQVSAGELLALDGGLHTPVVNLGLTFRFGTIKKA
jgi:hypothetical protein